MGVDNLTSLNDSGQAVSDRRCFWLSRAVGEMRAQILREVFMFLGLTFFITWGIAAVAIVAPDLLLGDRGLDGGRGRAFFYVAVFGPTLAGLILTLSQRGISHGCREILSGMIAPGRPVAWLTWLALSVMILPAAWVMIYMLGYLGLGGQAIGHLDFPALLSTPIILVTTPYLLTDPGPLGEEYGWRGYLLPRLLAILDPLRASVVIGIVWGIWHLPAFFNAATGQSELVYVYMMANWIGWSMVSTWIFIRSGGNWLLPGVISHAVVNASIGSANAVAVDPVYALSALLAASLLILIRGADLDLRRMQRDSSSTSNRTC